MIKPSDLEKQATEMVSAGKMPKLDDLLSAVADAREKFADKLVAARKEKHAGADALKS
jgi:hypothetical protein